MVIICSVDIVILYIIICVYINHTRYMIKYVPKRMQDVHSTFYC